MGMKLSIKKCFTGNSLYTFCAVIAVIALSACSVSYKFNGASIDYSKTKTIQIADFPIRSSYVWGPMGPIFNNAISSEGYSAQTELSMTVNVRFTNNTNHKEDFEQQFTATKSYETTLSLNAVQEELVTQMVKELTDQIFNATVANW